MMPKSLLASALIAWSLSLAGCQIYFGDEEDDYSYCDDSGCYWCDDFGCYPDGTDGGLTCEDNADCENGCYCDANGWCQEGGFCTEETEATDCAPGFVCDDRGSCVPGGSDACTTDEECATGSYCDDGFCIGSETCSNDDQCGEGYDCDEARGTCEPTAPALCQAEVTCADAPPACPQGSNPGIVDGCWSGECILDADCSDGAPVTCIDHTTEDACIADAACDPVFKGLNCTKPDGGSCTSGSANCTCESFVFDECEDHT
jgi:hypothetical protein